MNKHFRYLAPAASLVLGLSILSACAPAPVVTVTDQQINAAQESGELESLYYQIKAQVAGLDREKSAADFARLDEVGRQLAAARAAEVRVMMQEAALDDGLVPLSVLNEAGQRADKIQEWNPEIAATLAAEITEAKVAANTAVGDATVRLRALSADQHKERIALLEELAALTGDPSYLQQRATLVQSLATQAAQAQEAENLEQAKTLLDALPDSAETRQQRAQVDRKLFEKRFNKALADNQPDEAFRHFAVLASSPNWADIKPDLKETGKVMVTYFTSLATDATQKGKLADAYRWFSQANHMDAALELGNPRETMQPFLTEIETLASKARKSKGGQAQELGLLYIVAELAPERSSVSGRINELQNEIGAIAPREVSTTAFRDPSGDYKFGDKIAAGITQYLFDAIPQDVRIIEREQYDAIKREQDLRGAGNLSSVDYLITGSVLEAKVENTQQQNRRTMRVVTETGTRANPAYLEWLKLTEEQQSRIPAPEQREEFETREDVKINVTIHRKVGIFSVSYRLIDAANGKVIFPDSVTESLEFSDESTEGVQLGDFSLDFKLADLPSDVEILNKLAAKISKDIGEKLTEQLNRQEQIYADAGRREAEEGHYRVATDLMARAEAIARAKELNAEALRSDLSRYALESATKG